MEEELLPHLQLEQMSQLVLTLRKQRNFLVSQSSPQAQNHCSANTALVRSGINSRIRKTLLDSLSRKPFSLELRMLTQESVFMLDLMIHTQLSLL